MNIWVREDIIKFDFQDVHEAQPQLSDSQAQSECADLQARLKIFSTKELNRSTAITRLLQLHEKVNNQYKLYLQTKEELLLLRDRTKLYTVHSFRLGRIRNRSRNPLLQAQLQGV